MANIPNIVAVKEASGNISQIASVVSEVRGSDFKVYSGDDGIILPVMSLGADGLISVASNVIPKQMVDMVHSIQNGDIKTAQDLFFKYRPLMEIMFCETNPIPVKFACSKLGYGENLPRLPLTPISETGKIKVLDEMYNVGLIK